MNGNAHPAENSTIAAAEAQLDAQLRLTIGIMFRGILVSSPGLPPDVLMKSIVRLVGEMIGNTIVGDLAPVLKLRRACKEAFEHALSKTPIQPDNRPMPNLTG